MQNIWRAAPLTAEITFLPPTPVLNNRKALSQLCEVQIAAVFHQSSNEHSPVAMP
jgi:hypothetical protein